MSEDPESIPLFDYLRPWVAAALFASAAVVLWGLLLPWPPPGRRPSRFAFPFTLLEPLSDQARAAVQGAAVSYWALGLCLSRRAFLGAAWTRAYVARVLAAGGMGVLGLVLPLLAVVWMLAALMGVIPDGPWNMPEGNHGPWRRIPDLRKIVSFSLTLPGYSLLLARGSLLLRMSREGWAVTFASMVVFMALIASHYWLID